MLGRGTPFQTQLCTWEKPFICPTFLVKILFAFSKSVSYWNLVPPNPWCSNRFAGSLWMTFTLRYESSQINCTPNVIPARPFSSKITNEFSWLFLFFFFVLLYHEESRVCQDILKSKLWWDFFFLPSITESYRWSIRKLWFSKTFRPSVQVRIAKINEQNRYQVPPFLLHFVICMYPCIFHKLLSEGQLLLSTCCALWKIMVVNIHFLLRRRNVSFRNLPVLLKVGKESLKIS